ncbi:RF-1 domain-containing protein [Aspergillus nidulans var. acristatus]
MLRRLRLLTSNIALAPLRNSAFLRQSLQRPISASTQLAEKSLPPRIKLDDADITIAYLKGTGPGGQKINKTNSAVQLIHKPTGIVVKSQATRSRSQNEKYARQILADKVEQFLKGDQSRIALKAERERKKKASRSKKSRRKYRELEEKKSTEEKGDTQSMEVEGEINAAERPG